MTILVPMTLAHTPVARSDLWSSWRPDPLILGILALVESLVITKVVTSGTAPPATLGPKATPALQESPASLDIRAEKVLPLSAL